MAYTDDAVKAKLSALNETQDGIMGVAQWVMFHRRHADRTAQLWLQRLKDSTATKRLNLIYLANEIAQQSRVRKKMEFISAFSPIVAEGTTTAYRSATQELQQKIRRVVEVWRQRNVFDLPVQESIEKGLDEIDKTRQGGKKGGLGGSLFSSGPTAPTELQPLIAPQNDLTKAEIAYRSVIETANAEYDRVTNPDAKAPTPPVHAHQLSNVLKTLANAEGAVAQSIKCRRTLIEGLEKLLATNRTALSTEETYHYELSSKKTTIEAKKREVEDGIMRGLTSGHAGNGAAYEDETNRPDVEQLTPPPVESLTPTGSPPPQDQAAAPVEADASYDYPPQTRAELDGMADAGQPVSHESNPGFGTVPSSLKRQMSEEGGGLPFKRRSLKNDGPEFAGEVTLDADVADMLG
ncbi:DUF618-domain-containing protein [Pseudovirgaria hyperparasitica]|uniref:DUF618-domain-containing protein n=1 Tax=Pseudovirgaria hyperparasitica TaxID=470096 RepID=A0A6A6WCA7_9PEZI|nr:DUF618-domain-containing protein [Pseudovirgaria hyperparasitica]KAF2759197.1 DUF618-domain-containing protein [Pseudovirgaria hyperparasitica]